MLKEMTREDLEKRMSEIATEIDKDDANLDALEEEAKEIKEELEERKTLELKKAEIRSKVALGEGAVVETFEEEERKEMTNAEVRKSAEYINAYAEYIKTGDSKECRALLTENVDGGIIPVPSYVEDRVRTAWEKTSLMQLVRKTYIKGNLRLGFEVSATGAVVHTEGGKAIDPEELVLGTVQLIPQSIKKLIQISDEALDLKGAAFLDYIYDELTFRIAQKAEEVLIGLIVNAPTEVSTDGPSVAELEADLGIATVATALGQLSPEATNPVIVTTRANWSALKVAAYNAQYSIDPFEGLSVHFVGAAAMGGASLIVGDFGYGAIANFPNGAEIEIKVDDKTDMASDLVNILGRQFVALGIVADKAFVRVMEGESE